LKKILTSKEGWELWRTALQIPGMVALVDLSAKNIIKSWAVFSAEAYRYFCDDRILAKNSPEMIVKAVDD
jgi:hypothetical protein